MFDIGFSELLVIAVVALIVLGPERLPKAARFAGLWVRKARAQWYSVKSEFEREMAADELRRSLAEPAAQLRDQVAQAGRDVRASVADVDREMRTGADEAADALRDTDAGAATAPAPSTPVAADEPATAPPDEAAAEPPAEPHDDSSADVPGDGGRPAAKTGAPVDPAQAALDFYRTLHSDDPPR
jgi:sec-independent protein translocase protein TatB